MATLLDTYNLATGTDGSILLAKCTAAVAKTAQAILSEPPQTQNHSNRLRWAKAALVDPSSEAKRMLWAVLGNPTVQANGASTPDSDLEWVVGQLVNIFAGES